jgi:light-regulated signal transduction histidine kinase (bacteriophytochrome)
MLTENKGNKGRISMNSYSDNQWADFLDSLVHDLREPLRAINAYSQMLTEVVAECPGGESDRAVGEILAGASRMQTLLTGLSGLSLALHETDDSGGASLQLAFNIVSAAMGNQIQACGASVTGAGLPRVCVKLERLVQLLENLLGNALKFRGEDPPVITITSREGPGDQWTTQVKDNGLGISPQDCEAVFHPFKRLEGKKYAGAGLGLTICRTIVETHGGEIWMQPGPVRGSVCSFTLPGA